MKFTLISPISALPHVFPGNSYCRPAPEYTPDFRFSVTLALQDEDLIIRISPVENIGELFPETACRRQFLHRFDTGPRLAGASGLILEPGLIFHELMCIRQSFSHRRHGRFRYMVFSGKTAESGFGARNPTGTMRSPSTRMSAEQSPRHAGCFMMRNAIRPVKCVSCCFIPFGLPCPRTPLPAAQAGVRAFQDAGGKGGGTP